jgi:hypothetical protein
MIEIDLSRYVSHKIIDSRRTRTPRDSTTVLDAQRRILSDIAFIKLYRCMPDAPGVYESEATHGIVCEELEVAYTMGDSIRTSMR